MSNSLPWYLEFSFWLMMNLIIMSILYLAFGFDGVQGQDSHHYLQFSKCLGKGIFAGNSCSIDFQWPFLYPFLGALFSFFNTHLVLLLLSGISFAGVLTIVGQWWKGRPHVFLFQLLFVCFSPFLLRSSLLVKSDLLAAFFVFFASYLLCISVKKNRLQGNLVLLTALVMSAAIFTRIVSIIPVVILLLCVFFANDGCRKFLKYIAVTVPILLLFLLVNNQFVPALFQDASANSLLNGWSFSNLFARSFSSIDGMSSYGLPNIIHVTKVLWYPGFIFLGTVFFFAAFSQRSADRFPFLVLCIPSIVYLLFLAFLPLQNDRLLLLVFPLLLTAFYPGFERTMSYLKNKRGLSIALMLLVLTVQLLLFVRAIRPAIELANLEREIGRELKDQEVQKLYVFGLQQALRTYSPEMELVSLWPRVIDDFSTDAHLLVNAASLTGQWAGKSPHLNYEKIQIENSLKKLKDFENGWVLYEVN